MNSQTRILKGIYPSVEETNWDKVYQEYLPRVYNFFRYKVGDQPLAEDLTAATFEKAWRGRMRFRHEQSAFSTWLFTIARNVATDHFRRRGRDISLETIRDQANPTSLEESVQHKNDLARLNNLLSQLPARERELIALKHGAGLTNREVAHLTHLSESNVGTILHRVIENLRLELEVKP